MSAFPLFRDLEDSPWNCLIVKPARLTKIKEYVNRRSPWMDRLLWEVWEKVGRCIKDSI